MSKPNPRRRNGNARDKLRARVAAQHRPCHLCGYPIDYSAHHLSKTAFVLDELTPVSRGGSPLDYNNVAPAHRCCNSWRGNKPVTKSLRVMCKRRFECEVMGKRANRPDNRAPKLSKTYKTSTKWL